MTKGYYFDQGMRPTHKAEIIGLYESGKDESVIARQTDHSQASVGKYIRDYERVKTLIGQGMSIENSRVILEMQASVIRAYLSLLEQYHPELLSTELEH